MWAAYQRILQRFLQCFIHTFTSLLCSPLSPAPTHRILHCCFNHPSSHQKSRQLAFGSQRARLLGETSKKLVYHAFVVQWDEQAGGFSQPKTAAGAGQHSLFPHHQEQVSQMKWFGSLKIRISPVGGAERRRKVQQTETVVVLLVHRLYTAGRQRWP